MYTVKANRGCLSYNNDELKTSICDGKEQQQFTVTNIKNKEEYNSHLNIPVDDYSEVFYPFSIVNPKNDKNKCLSMKGSSLGIHDCKDTIYQRWNTKGQLDKECRGKYSN